MPTYDAIIVGAGHNGLVSAAYLAKAGRKVLVLEARDVVGGMAWSMEMPNAPGYKVNPCSVEFLLTGVQPSVDAQLELDKHGLQWVYPDTMLTWLGPDGQVMPLWRDRARLVREIERYSRKDARKYEQLVDEITVTLMTALPYLQGHPMRVRPRALWEMLSTAAKGRKHIARGARAMLSSIEAVCEEYFERDEIKVPLACYSLASFAPAWEQGTGLHLSLICGLHEWGVRHPVGGTGGYTQALARCVEYHGGEILCGAAVQEIVTSGGRAKGVKLWDGREFAAPHVVAAVAPQTLINDLLDPAVVPDEVNDQMRGIQSLHTNIYTFKVDAALDRRLRFPHHGEGREDEALSAITICPDMGYMNRSANNATVGEFTAEIPIQHITPSIYDRTMVPEGSDGDNLYMYAFNTPVKLSNGRSWDDEKQRYTDLMLANFAQYCPDIRDAIIDIDVTSPDDFVRRYNCGNYEHVDCTLANMGPFRPVPALAGYRTPIQGVWHTAAGAFPMAFLSGWPGRNGAREVLRDMDAGPVTRYVDRLMNRRRPKAGDPVTPDRLRPAAREVPGYHVTGSADPDIHRKPVSGTVSSSAPVPRGALPTTRSAAATPSSRVAVPAGRRGDDEQQRWLSVCPLPRLNHMAGPDRSRAPVRRRDLMQDLGRRRGEEGDVREAILSAAERLLADRRLDDLTVVDIIEAARISRATFYLYFESKHAPIAALAQEVLEELTEELWGAWLAGDEPATESVMAGHWLQTIARWREHQVVLVAAAQGWRTDPEAYAHWGATFQRYVARVVQYIERARAVHGAPSDLDVSTLAALLMWLNECTIYTALTGQAPELADDERLAKTLAGLWTRAIYASSP